MLAGSPPRSPVGYGCGARIAAATLGLASPSASPPASPGRLLDRLQPTRSLTLELELAGRRLAKEYAGLHGKDAYQWRERAECFGAWRRQQQKLGLQLRLAELEDASANSQEQLRLEIAEARHNLASEVARSCLLSTLSSSRFAGVAALLPHWQIPRPELASEWLS